MGHTPGPWTIEYETDGGEPYDDGVRIDSPEGPVAFRVIDCSAHLIAAAPEMLKTLRFVLPVLENAARRGTIDSEGVNLELEAAREVSDCIAQAEGRGE
jgi:hypothetical protein